MEKYVKFSDRLKQIRESRQMTQQELAAKTGMIQSAIAHFEGDRRKPSFQNIRILSQALGISSDYLMGTAEGGMTAFRNEEKLSEKDREYIQGFIDVMINKKES